MIKADIKIHNVVYECAGCGEFRKVTEEKPIAILKLIGIKPIEKTKPEDKAVVNDYDMVYNTVFVEPSCFEELDLVEEEPKNG